MRRRAGLFLALHAGMALLWGVFLAVLPYSLLMVTAILWLPLFIFGEYRWVRKHGVPAAALSSLGLISAVLFGAHLQPKIDDEPIGGSLLASLASLGDLAKADPRFRVPSALETLRVRFPSANPSLRQAIESVEAQTPLRCEVGRCGTGGSVLSGMYALHVRIVAATPPSAAAPGGAP